ncbi:MAG: CBS domain-containing protein [Euryarchaeota archaeon]|nr:CBS domain-containing protein [Euryarchaeota archaeon]
MKVSDVMSDEVVVIQDNEQIGHVKNLILKHGFSRIVVIDENGVPVGIVTEKDIARKLRGNGPAWRRRPIDKISVRRVMNNKIITINPDREIKDAVELMIKNNISSIVVVDGEGLAGIITKTDLMRIYSEKFQGRWKVEDIMTPDVITVNENHAITQVISLMEKNNIGIIIVMRDNEPVGFINSSNIFFASFEDPETGVSVEKIYFVRKVDGKDKKDFRLISMLTAGDIMTKDLLKIGKDEDATGAAKMMFDEDISGIPVVEDGSLVGIITKTDVIKGIQ